MPKPTKKTKKKAAKGGKSPAQKRKAIVTILALLVAVILCGEAVFFMKGQLNIPRDYPVQLAGSFKGDNQACGPFAPWDIKSGPNWIAMTDQPRERVLIFDLQGHYLRQIDSKAAGKPDFKEISCLATDGQKTIYVMDTWNALIRYFNVDTGKPMGVLDMTTKGMFGPRGVAWDNGDFIVADTGTHHVDKLSPSGQVLATWDGAGGKTKLLNPIAAAVDSQGRIFVANEHGLKVLSPDGKVLQDEESLPVNDVAVGPGDTVYAALRDSGDVKVFNSQGKYVGTLSTAGVKDQWIDGVRALTVLPGGDLACVRGGEVDLYHAVPQAAPAH
ncbi:MAG TPA: NHL repeat-containing protein [bacterium]|nr:NHL repeat-containing protein [bacterium]